MSEKHVSENIFDQIQQLCDDFRSNWKSNKQPRIEDYLTKVPENARETLFRNLLPVDIRYRERNRQQPCYDDYLNRFPQFQRAIGDAFNYTTSLEVQAVHETAEYDDVQAPSDATTDFGPVPTKRVAHPVRSGAASRNAEFKTVPPENAAQPAQPAAISRIGDYQLVRELGRGGFGVVYEALHETHGIKVALKTLLTGGDGQEINAERLHKFRREFRSLAEINHPNLVGMQTLEVDGGQWFFTMDLVDGVDFLRYVRPNGQLDEDRLRSAMRQLAAGVLALHDRFILHCDLKPSNVLVSPEGHVWILDFGLVTHLEQHPDQPASLQSQHFAGTPRYAAPEQIFGERYPASDWYAIGTMLYETLVGQAPFQGNAAKLLISKRVDDPPVLLGRDDVPPDLANLVDRLLYRDPAQRANPDEIIEALGLDPSTISIGSRDDNANELSSSEELSAPELIGRDEQLATLERSKQTFLADHQPQVVWIAGLSGEGKSSLADKFLDSFRIDDTALVLSGRCYDRESVPFKAVDVLIESLVRFLRSRETVQVTAWLPRDIQMLARLFPTLRRVEAIERQPPLDLRSLDDRQIRYRGFSALSELLVTIGREIPVVLFIDDLQWGDADSAEVLVDMLVSENPPAMLLLGSYRSDEADQSPFLQEWRSRTERKEEKLSATLVEVGPLTEEQCLKYLAQSIGMPVEAFREQTTELLADTKGNPYFLEQLVEGFNQETGCFEPVPLHEIIERKLTQLPENARDLLTTVAIAGQAVSIDEASSVAGYETPLFSTVTHMRSERLVRLIGAGGQQSVDTYHDKIRENVIKGMDEDAVHTLHSQFGEYLEKQNTIPIEELLEYLGSNLALSDAPPPATERVSDLAYHFFAAGDERAFVYQLLAGEWSYRAYASDDAIDYLRRAESIIPNASNANVRYRVAQRLANSLARSGQFEDAIEEFRRAIDLAPSTISKAASFVGLASVYQCLGQYETARDNYDRALQEIGAVRPLGVKALLLCIPMAVRIFCFPRNVRRGKTEEVRARESLLYQIYLNTFQYNYDRSNALIDFVYGSLRLGLLSLRSEDDSKFAIGMSVLAGFFVLSGMPGAGRYLLKRTRHITDQNDDLEAQALYEAYTALVKHYTSDLKTADQLYRSAVPKLISSGALLLGAPCPHMHRHLLSVCGNASEECEKGEQVLSISQKIGDVRGQCWGHYDKASGFARKGELLQALEEMNQARGHLLSFESNLTDSIFLATEGFVRLQVSDYQTAREVCDKAWRLIKQRKVVMEVNLRAVPWLIEALAGPDWIEADLAASSPMRKLCRVARVLGWTYPIMKPHLHRVRGRAFWRLGKRQKAIRNFERAVRTARACDANFDLARSLLDLAAAQEKDREENRRTAINLLNRLDSVIPRAEAWQLGDQFDDAVVAAEFDLAAWEREFGTVSQQIDANKA